MYITYVYVYAYVYMCHCLVQWWKYRTDKHKCTVLSLENSLCTKKYWRVGSYPSHSSQAPRYICVGACVSGCGVWKKKQFRTLGVNVAHTSVYDKAKNLNQIYNYEKGILWAMVINDRSYIRHQGKKIDTIS
jgi:hypothetical protein